jgi:quercetin dioxygenase-like cupin family protein
MLEAIRKFVLERGRDLRQSRRLVVEEHGFGRAPSNSDVPPRPAKPELEGSSGLPVRGQVKWFNPNKGYGFVRLSVGSPTPPAPPRAASSDAAARQRFAIAIGLLAVAGLAVSAPAQTPPAAPAIARTVVAGTKLASLDNTPLYFKAASVSIPAGQKISFSARPNGILYQLSGSTEVSAGEPKTITTGGGVLTAGETTASLTAGSGEQSTLLYFLLVPQEALDQPVAATPATVNELYRTAAPLPELKPGSYELNLTRVTFPPGMPSNAPHHRSGAALYYIVSGIGANTVNGKTADRGPGSLIYEPFGLVHQWGNPGSEPLTFLAFNINPEGVPAVVPETPTKP